MMQIPLAEQSMSLQFQLSSILGHIQLSRKASCTATQKGVQNDFNTVGENIHTDEDCNRTQTR